MAELLPAGSLVYAVDRDGAVDTAAIVSFMRVGDYVETVTAERARHAAKGLTALAPQAARLLRNGEEVEMPIAQVTPGDTAIVRPGEQIPMDGEVIEGQSSRQVPAATSLPPPSLN